jgi:hypothetical protein
VSSILDALEKLESRRTHASGPEPPRRRRRSVTPLLAGAALLAFAAGIGLTVVWLRPVESTSAPNPATVTTPVPTTPPPTVARVAPPSIVARVAPPPTPALPRPVEQPWAEVVTPPGPRDVAQTPPSTAAPAVRNATRERPANRAEATPAAAAEPAPPPTTRAATAARPAGAPPVRVSFLVYSGAPERRSVALSIDGGLVTLHEGEDSGGLSVTQILPDGVQLTWQGQSFKVPARD